MAKKIVDTDGVTRRFYRLSRITLIILYFLIFAGVLVRSTGAGMGCPDWPKCFGQWIPPVSEMQLPENYQEIYKDHGYDSMRFNVVKTWTEYLNRLLGAVFGFFTLALALSSLMMWRHDRLLVYLSFIVMVLTGIQAVLGAIVVYTNLLPSMVSVHMIVAVLILAFMVWIMVRTRSMLGVSLPPMGMKRLFWPILGALLLFVLQMILGLNVREVVDSVALQSQFSDRHLWAEALGNELLYHRGLAIGVLVVLSWISILLFRLGKISLRIRRLAWMLLLFLIIEMAVGSALVLFDFPMILQPFHLLLAVWLFGMLFELFLMSLGSRFNENSQFMGRI